MGRKARLGHDDRRHHVAAHVGAVGVAGGEDRAAGGGTGGVEGGEAEARDGAGHPPSGGEVFRRGDELVNRFQFVEDHKDAYGVKRLCEIVEIARSSFYAWLAAAPGRAARAAEDTALAARIRVLQDPAQGGDRAYGAPRITADLNDGVTTAAERVNHKRVARVMREHQLVGIRLRRRVKTTIPDQSGRKFPDLIGRDFSIGEPNRRYVGDITYLPIADGSNLYLATCIDLGSRKLAGWQVADHMRTEIVEDALRAAARDRGSLAGAVFHSDHGSVGGFNRSSQHPLGITGGMG
ncbi:IS3 family transposase, partial [Mesorhizobium sp. B2-6-6]